MTTYFTATSLYGHEVHTAIKFDDDRPTAKPMLICGTSFRYRLAFSAALPEDEARDAATCTRCLERTAFKRARVTA